MSLPQRTFGPMKFGLSLRDHSVLLTGGAGFIGSRLVDCLITEAPRNIDVVDSFFWAARPSLRTPVPRIPILRCFGSMRPISHLCTTSWWNTRLRRLGVVHVLVTDLTRPTTPPKPVPRIPGFNVPALPTSLAYDGYNECPRARPMLGAGRARQPRVFARVGATSDDSRSEAIHVRRAFAGPAAGILHTSRLVP
jgi:hypothetical protein